MLRAVGVLVAQGVGGIWFGVVRWRRCDWFCGGGEAVIGQISVGRGKLLEN